MGFFDLLEDLATVVTAPVRIVARVAEVVVRPIAEVAEAAVDEVQDFVRDIVE